MIKLTLKSIGFSICSILLMGSLLQAQSLHEVTGTVYDRESGTSMPGATVSVLDSQRGTVTDSNGRYLLELEPGNFELVASFVGFHPDTISVTVESGKDLQFDFHLNSRVIEGDDVIVYGDRVDQRVRELARLRQERRESLENYSVMVHKLGLLYEIERSRGRGERTSNENLSISASEDLVSASLIQPANIPESSNSDTTDTSQAIAFSERVVQQLFVTPKRYAERYVGRRSSDNFFSEHEIFSTGGSPLDLNDEKVDINLLSEVVSIVGPISQRAPNFYFLQEEAAGDNWPEGTTKITLDPKSNQRPLFKGTVYINDENDEIIGMDLTLNEAGRVSTGVYSLSDFKYYQKYEQVDGYWLPSRTEIEARLGIIGFSRDFIYRDRWVYKDYQINQEELTKGVIPLSGSIVEQRASSRDQTYWQETEQQFLDDRDLQEVEKAMAYEENRFIVNFFMSAFQTYYQAPTFIENSYFTNISDFYRFNKVEGHYFGLGLRTPAVNDRFTYKGAVGYATEANDWRFNLQASQFIPRTNLAVEGGVYKQLALQFADYPHQVSPLNIDEFRYTLTAGFAGYDPRNYFEREGFQAGLRYQFQPNFFLRANYMREDQTFLPTVSTENFFGGTLVKDQGGEDHNLNPNVGRTPESARQTDQLEGFTEGRFSGFEFHLHYDNRQFRTNGIFRNYLVREFGWFTDHLAYWSDPSFRSGSTDAFNYFKYRSSIGMRLPMFASHYLFGALYVGGSNNPLPAQMQFSNNGFYVEDYIRHRPFLSLGFNEGIGNRVTAARLDYDFGTAFVRAFPSSSIRQSGIGFHIWGSAGYRHDEADLSPVMPWTDGMQEHYEVGFAVTRIFGLFSIDIGFRLRGNAGSKVGMTLII